MLAVQTLRKHRNALAGQLARESPFQKFSQEVQLDIDGQGVRWRRSRPAAENTLPLLLSTIYIINNIKNIHNHKGHLVAVLPALLHIKVFVIVEGIVIKSSESR